MVDLKNYNMTYNLHKIIYKGITKNEKCKNNYRTSMFYDR